VPPRAAFLRLQPQTSERRAHTLLRASIRDGLISPGDQLVEDALVRALATSRNSVRKALQMLVDERMVTRQPHHGTRVVSGIRRVSLDQPNLRAVLQPAGPGHVVWSRLERQTVPAPQVVAAKLEVEPGTRLLVTEHLLTLDDEPYALRVGYQRARPEGVDPDRGAGPDVEQEAIADILDVYSRTRSTLATIEAVACDARAAELLGMTAGSPVLLHEMLLVGEDGTPEELSYNSYRTGRVALSASSTVVAPFIVDAG
jgi:GntR family transcriptional regulator